VIEVKGLASKANREVLGQQTRVVTSDAKVVVLKNTGHWVLEENPKERLTHR
jgi:hypothetical protein